MSANWPEKLKRNKTLCQFYSHFPLSGLDAPGQLAASEMHDNLVPHALRAILFKVLLDLYRRTCFVSATGDEYFGKCTLIS